MAGLEPARCCQRGILSPLRLPIPSHRRDTQIVYPIEGKNARVILPLREKMEAGIRENRKNFGISRSSLEKPIEKNVNLTYDKDTTISYGK